MSGRLEGRVAVVTGAGQQAGATIGNGRATAVTFAREGAVTVLVDRDRESAEATARMIADEGGTAVALEGDVASADDWAAVVAVCTDRFGRLDIVHNNVGVALGDGPVDTVGLEAWERVMRINTGSLLLMAQAVLPVMRAAERGVITNVSSIAAVAASTNPRTNTPAGYKTSKAAMNALTQTLALENARYGIRVNAIMPGLVDTPIGVDLPARMTGTDRDEYAARRDSRVPLKGGMGTAWDVANAAAFLASDEAGFITGAVLPVDGGQSARIG